eukprot:c2029_g1_i1.p1 GENE.c2029_g1_i1~~c2029_g1_i1.p1  ORF type:complete len:949 (-),score=238.00 c2029_g1_i1:304-3150(-)
MDTVTLAPLPRDPAETPQLTSVKIFSLVEQLLPLLTITMTSKDCQVPVVRISDHHRGHAHTPIILVSRYSHAVFSHFTSALLQADVRAVHIILHHVIMVKGEASTTRVLCNVDFLESCFRARQAPMLLYALRLACEENVANTQLFDNIKAVELFVAKFGQALTLHPTLVPCQAHTLLPSHTPTSAPVLVYDNASRDEVYGQDQGFVSFSTHAGAATGIAFTPDGKFIVSGHSDGSVRVRHLASQCAEVCTFYSSLVTGVDEGCAAVYDVAVSRDRALGDASSIPTSATSINDCEIACGCGSGHVVIWNLKTQSIIGSVKVHSDKVWCCRFANTSPLLCCSSFDKTASILKLNRVPVTSAGDSSKPLIEVLAHLKGHQAPVNAIDFSKDDLRCVTASDDKTVRIWDVQSGLVLNECRAHSALVLDVAFSKSGQNIASASADESIKFWKASTGESFGSLKGHRGSVERCRFTDTGTHLVTSATDNTVRVWDCKTQLSARTICLPPSHTLSSIALGPSHVSSNHKEPPRFVIATGSTSGEIRILTISVLENTASSQKNKLPNHESTWGGATYTDFAPLPTKDGKDLVAAAFFDRTVRIFQLVTQKDKSFKTAPFKQLQLLQELQGHEFTIYCCRFSPDGSQLATASADGTLRVWARQGNSSSKFASQPMCVLTGHEGTVWVCAYAGSDSLISCGADGTIREWTNGRSSILFQGREDEEWVAMDVARATPRDKTPTASTSSSKREVTSIDPNNTYHIVCVGSRGRLVVLRLVTRQQPQQNDEPSVQCVMNIEGVSCNRPYVRIQDHVVVLGAGEGNNMMMKLNLASRSHMVVPSPFRHAAPAMSGSESLIAPTPASSYVALALKSSASTATLILSDGTVHVVQCSDNVRPRFYGGVVVGVGVGVMSAAVNADHTLLIVGTAVGKLHVISLSPGLGERCKDVCFGGVEGEGEW